MFTCLLRQCFINIFWCLTQAASYTDLANPSIKTSTKFVYQSLHILTDISHINVPGKHTRGIFCCGNMFYMMVVALNSIPGVRDDIGLWNAYMHPTHQYIFYKEY